MTFRIGTILPTLAAGVAVLSLGACTEAEQKGGSSILKALGVTTSVPQAFVVQEALEGVVETPEPCVIGPTEWRMWMCDDEGRKVLIP